MAPSRRRPASGDEGEIVPLAETQTREDETDEMTPSDGQGPTRSDMPWRNSGVWGRQSNEVVRRRSAARWLGIA